MKLATFGILSLLTLNIFAHPDNPVSTIRASIIIENCEVNLQNKEILEAKLRRQAQQNCGDRFTMTGALRNTFRCEGDELIGDAIYRCIFMF